MTLLRLLRKLLLTTDWRIFAFIAAVLVLNVAVPILTNPRTFEIVSYSVIRSWAPAAVWGWGGVILAVGVIRLLIIPAAAAWFALALGVYAQLLGVGFALATGPTAGLWTMTAYALLALWAFVRSAPLRGRRA